MKRKLLSIVLALCLTLTLLPTMSVAAGSYADTNGHWAESSIERWSAYGIIQGSNGQFDPNGQLTCAQLATILAKLLKLPAAKDAGFSDNKADTWYYDAINRCAAAGILNGNGDGTVTPEAPISRERAMVMLGRALGIEPIREPDLTKYTDAAKVAPYAQGMVAAMIEAGIVGGVTADELAPQDNINRASTVTILDRAISTYADEAGATVKADGKGIVLVVADDVTVTGDVDKLLVPADNVDVTVSGSKNIDDITVTGDNSKVILNNSTANDVTLDGKNTELETKSGSKVENVSVTEDAKGATVNAGSGTTVKNVENSAADTTVTGSGSVKNVASDTDVTVETKDTDVKNIGDSKINVTDKNGKDTTVGTTGSGSSTTVNKETTSSGGGYSHSHSYDTSKWVFDDTKHWHASTCGHNLKIDEAEHTYNDSNVCTVCGQVKADVAVAKIGNQNYKTLPEAVAAAADGAIVTVVKNISLDSRIVIAKKVTVDLNGKTVTRDMSKVSADFTRNEGNLFTIQSAGDLTLKDSTGNGMLTAIAPAGNHYSTDTLVLNYGKFTLESGTIKVPEKVYYAVGCYGKDSVTTINGGVIDAQWGSVSDGGIALGSNGSKSDATYGFTLNINGGEIKGGEQTLYLPGAGKTTITGGKLTGSARGIEIRAGELTITGGEISANVARSTDASANNGASGSYTGVLVAVKPASVSDSAYVGDIVLNISGGTFTNASGDVLTVVHETATAQDAPAQNVTVSVSDGQFAGAFNVGNTVNTIANDKLSLTGGTFSSDPSAYVAEGYTVKALEGGKYQVVALFDGGTGTAEDPFLIATSEQFKAIDQLNGASYCFKQTADIAVAAGDEVTKFAGVYDGGNQKLSSARTSGNFAFLFGVDGLSGHATFKNINVTMGELATSLLFCADWGTSYGADFENLTFTSTSELTKANSNNFGFVVINAIYTDNGNPATYNFENITVNVNLQNTGTCTGVLIGSGPCFYVATTMNFTNCMNNGTITGTSSVGFLYGNSAYIKTLDDSGTIIVTNCITNAVIKSTNDSADVAFAPGASASKSTKAAALNASYQQADKYIVGNYLNGKTISVTQNAEADKFSIDIDDASGYTYKLALDVAATYRTLDGEAWDGDDVAKIPNNWDEAWNVSNGLKYLIALSKDADITGTTLNSFHAYDKRTAVNNGIKTDTLTYNEDGYAIVVKDGTNYVVFNTAKDTYIDSSVSILVYAYSGNTLVGTKAIK